MTMQKTLRFHLGKNTNSRVSSDCVNVKDTHTLDTGISTRSRRYFNTKQTDSAKKKSSRISLEFYAYIQFCNHFNPDEQFWSWHNSPLCVQKSCSSYKANAQGRIITYVVLNCGSQGIHTKPPPAISQ